MYTLFGTAFKGRRGLGSVKGGARKWVYNQILS